VLPPLPVARDDGVVVLLHLVPDVGELLELHPRRPFSSFGFPRVCRHVDGRQRGVASSPRARPPLPRHPARPGDRRPPPPLPAPPVSARAWPARRGGGPPPPPPARRCLVTGAGRGIGAAVAQRL